MQIKSKYSWLKHVDFMVIDLIILATSAVFYAFKIGATYSSEMPFVKYGIYFVLSFMMKSLWKKLLIRGKVAVSISTCYASSAPSSLC